MQRKRKHINFPVTEEEHLSLKLYATKNKTTIKDILIDSLNKAHPDWNKEENKNSSK